ncbi:alpha/beta fold hydrolase [Mesobacillus zeae]|uniref:Alpha/beta hydrolase n=1 Tax=Mesobacillus zeae TaxID=1917180 RepID=A0A398BFP0_9BACI|nr:alpha/beta hydrolase [Mesobacillus zeae]RID88842.1 alpha/beta hydrolase [Mesobacillus zeae]
MTAPSFTGTKFINNIDVYYEHFPHASSTETVVLLHGFLSSTFSFRQLVPLLCKDFNVISVDLPPFGKSGKTTGFTYSYRNMAATVTSLLESLGITSYTLIGHSMGGQIALNVLYHFPKSAGKAVLLCSSGYSKRAAVPLVVSSYLPFFHHYVKYHFAKTGVRKNLQQVVHDHSLIDDEMEQGYLAPFLENRIFKALTNMIRHREGDLPPEALKRIHEPCLLIWGDHDRVVPLEIGKRLSQDLPNSELTVLKETGHLVPEEKPEAVYSSIKRFIGRKSLGTANGSQ